LQVFCSPGSAEALVRRGGKIKYLVIAYFFSNICAKNYYYRFVYLGVIARQSSDIFGTQYIFVMVALYNRADHYIFALRFHSFFSSFFFSSPNLSGRRLDVYHTSSLGVALV